jgi:hypothetical protein
MRAMFLVVLVVACGDGGFDVEPVTADYECSSLDCPILAGGELVARAVSFSDYTAGEVAQSVTVEPPELATATIDGDYIIIHTVPIAAGTEPAAAAPGLGTLHVTLVDGRDFYRTFSVEPRFTTAIVPDRRHVPLDAFPERRLPGEGLAMFDGESIVVYAEHHTVDGRRLLGHDDAMWSADGVQLAEASSPYTELDVALLRGVRGLATGAASVSLGTATLPLDIVPPHSAARLEIAGYTATYPAGASLHTHVGGSTSVRVLAYTADGRYIHGGPPFLPITVTSSDPSIVSGVAAAGSDRSVELTGYGSGTAIVTLSFDDVSIDVPFTVEI